MDKTIWEIYAKVYDSTMLQIIPYRRIIEHAYNSLQPLEGNYYIDAGCGTGNFLSYLIDLNDKVKAIGIDYSDVMLERARKKLNHKSNRIQLCNHDLNSKMPFDNNFFSGSVCLNVLYIMKNPGFLLKELNRVIDNNGKLVLSTPIKNPKISPIINEHVGALKNLYPKNWHIHFLIFLLRFFFSSLAVLIINIFITRSKKYFFFSEKDIRFLFQENGFLIDSLEVVYGNQIWLVVARKHNAKLPYEAVKQEE